MSQTHQLPVVFLESPYSGDIDRHVRYLLLCGFDAFARGEMPTSSHGTMTMHPAKLDFFVSDYDCEWDVFTREEAIERAHALRRVCDKTIFYVDMGWSNGMKSGLAYCKKHKIPFELRKLDVDLVVGLSAQLVTKDLIQDIVGGKEYTRHFKGTPLLDSSPTSSTKSTGSDGSDGSEGAGK